ncbi:hypothetical protein NAT51_07255 [Flavobacterium amniphilum]|uniref:hypothetical protein n=1 Tax=Flavobacterium amniphilum TaxID=1834035 RepID=UPI002029D3FF|nr:hypothetical protein [Flavobacterium amniphilum]MCL9805312.1 hypothetical protein [Flavobacterium amniphilum]
MSLLFTFFVSISLMLCKDDIKVCNIKVVNKEVVSDSLYKKIDLKCDKDILPVSCNYQDLKIKIDYSNSLNFLTVSNKLKEQKFSIQDNFSGTGLQCSLFESKSKKIRILIVDMEYEYSVESYFYLITSDEIKFAGKFSTETQTDDFQKLEYEISDDNTSAGIQIKNGNSIKKYVIAYTENKKVNHISTLPVTVVDLHKSNQQTNTETDLKSLKGEYYLDAKNEDVELLMEFDKDVAFLIESGNMGRLYNKHLLKYTIEGQRMKLHYIETKEGSPDVLKVNEKIAELFIENHALWIDSPYLKNKYGLGNKVKVIKTRS